MTPTPTPPAEVDVAEGRRLLEGVLQHVANSGLDVSHTALIFGLSASDVRNDATEALACLPHILTAAEQVAGLRETILSAANICEHWADESRNGGWSTHQVEPNRRLAASLRKAALGAAP